MIQVNTDLPTFIDRAVDLAAHEGYPGHHVYNSLLEKNLVRDRGWMEFSVYPLFSPQSLVAEGTANFGRDVAFPTKAERMKFEKRSFVSGRRDRFQARRRILRRAGFDEAARLRGKRGRAKIDQRRDRRERCGAMVAKIRSDGTSSRSAAGEIHPALPKLRDQLQSREDMVRRYIEKRSGTDPEKRWSEFAKLLSSPRLPSGIAAISRKGRKRRNAPKYSVLERSFLRCETPAPSCPRSFAATAEALPLCLGKSLSRFLRSSVEFLGR